MTVYLDCNATTPVEPEVVDELLQFTAEEYGNAGSRTHEFGTRAKKRVARAREQIAAVVNATPDEVVFTSGATESNNLAILGLEAHGAETGKRHIVASAIEHKAVLEPLAQLANRGFDVDLVGPTRSGVIDADAVLEKVRPDTLMVTLMHVNNETGVVQPIDVLAGQLEPDGPFLHVDAAQGFGKDLERLQSPRIDLVSISGHKVYAPKGIGALIVRKRQNRRLPLRPLMFGGGQERGLRPGTLAVGLIAALGTAAEIALRDHRSRTTQLMEHRAGALRFARGLGAVINGDPDLMLPNTLNLSIPGLDSEAAIVALKGTAAVSNGSACTSQTYEPSHVLRAMGHPIDRAQEAIRISWSHLTPHVPWEELHAALAPFVAQRSRAA